MVRTKEDLKMYAREYRKRDKWRERKKEYMKTEKYKSSTLKYRSTELFKQTRRARAKKRYEKIKLALQLLKEKEEKKN